MKRNIKRTRASRLSLQEAALLVSSPDTEMNIAFEEAAKTVKNKAESSLKK